MIGLLIAVLGIVVALGVATYLAGLVRRFLRKRGYIRRPR